MSTAPVPSYRPVATATIAAPDQLCRRPDPFSKAADKALQFRPMLTRHIPDVRRILALHAPGWRTCDFTVGGLFMWIDYFRYEWDIWQGTLFVRGLNEQDLSSEAYSVPVGAMPLRLSLDVLRRHCYSRGTPCVLSAVPGEAIELIGAAAPVTAIEPLDDWSDYLYGISSLASLQGKAMSKKRNHVNRFMADNPDHTFDPLDSSNIEAVRRFFAAQELAADKSMSADYERLQVMEVLSDPARFGFEGAVLSIPGRGVVAFAMGEVIADTLYVHIEKMAHDVPGAGETINCLFARIMQERHPQLDYVNREEDAGDPGLRKAKLSYHPLEIIRKYNVTLAV